MPVDQRELARRLKAAREASRLTQDDVARYLGVSRSTVAQMELGNRAVTSLELDKLAYLYGRDIRSFLADEFRPEDALVALFRRHPEMMREDQVLAAVRQSLAAGREVTNLERLLGVDADLATLPAYALKAPATKWEAIQQAERIASEERRRLGLGGSPLPSVAELLEAQGVRTARADLPQDVSGLTVADPDVGVLVVVNGTHVAARQRFSFAHEYCHVLLDRDQKGAISRAADRDTLPEVRANAFAAAFLMPADGVRGFLQGLAKGRLSRLRAEVFDEEAGLAAQARPAPGTQDIQLYDVVLLAHHFGVSRISALYRLKNLKLLDEPEFAALQVQEEAGRGKEIAETLGLAEHDEGGDGIRARIVTLALEAFRRREITRRKLEELGAVAGLAPSALEKVLVETGVQAIADDAQVLVPPE
ncbi:MAG TPA: XRE family transcriptional regulator [Gemmatimonadales bacterium]|nr:XRE family transcriptional regulator [Gemmatimonadales bacterium]